MGRRSSPPRPDAIMKPLLQVLWVFLDGVGLGPVHARNPLSSFRWPALMELAGGQAWSLETRPRFGSTQLFLPIDATLGVAGLPQSGTGQATLLTGFNCARIAGRHYGPYPHSRTHSVLARYNVFRRLQNRQRSVAFVNAYPPTFFTQARMRNRWNVTARCCLEAGVMLRDLQALAKGNALAADLTGQRLRDAGFMVTVIDETQAAHRLMHIATNHAFTLLEYFLTDQAGHSQDMAEAYRVLASLDRFFAALLDLLDPKQQLLLVTSDHGNLEDLRARTHTRNPVPLAAWGQGAMHFRHARDLRDITPTIVALLKAARA